MKSPPTEASSGLQGRCADEALQCMPLRRRIPTQDVETFQHDAEFIDSPAVAASVTSKLVDVCESSIPLLRNFVELVQSKCAVRDRAVHSGMAWSLISRERMARA